MKTGPALYNSSRSAQPANQWPLRTHCGVQRRIEEICCITYPSLCPKKLLPSSKVIRENQSTLLMDTNSPSHGEEVVCLLISYSVSSVQTKCNTCSPLFSEKALKGLNVTFILDSGAGAPESSMQVTFSSHLSFDKDIFVTYTSGNPSDFLIGDGSNLEV